MSFFLLVWWKVLLVLNIKNKWGKNDFSFYLYAWFLYYKKYRVIKLARLVSWNLWKMRNLNLFESIENNEYVVVERIEDIINNFH